MTDKDKLILEILDELASAVHELGYKSACESASHHVHKVRLKLATVRELIELEDAHANIGDCD